MTFLGPENFVRFEKHQKAFSGALRGAFLGGFEKRTPGEQGGGGTDKQRPRHTKVINVPMSLFHTHFLLPC